MKCPKCIVDLVMADRQGVEIDYCPQCRGVWLDRGELDKIIDRSLPQVQQFGQQPNYQQPNQPNYQQPSVPPNYGYAPQGSHDYKHHDKHYDHHHDQHYGKKRKRESFLEDLFDF